MIQIDGIRFERVEGAPYKHDYDDVIGQVIAGKVPEIPTLRELFRTDLFALVYFGMRVPINHPWWVSACNEVQDGPETDTVDVWAREHGKTTIVTIGDTIQRDVIKKTPLEAEMERQGAVDLSKLPGCAARIGIGSFAKDPAVKILRVFKSIFEDSTLLKVCFPEIFWESVNQAPKWSEEQGLILRRQGYAKEATIEAWGLIDGMPTGAHYTTLLFDDVVTLTLVKTPERMADVFAAFNAAQYLGSEGCRRRVCGTYYRHDDPLVQIVAQKDLDTGEPLWLERNKPGVEPAAFTGKPVFMSEKSIKRYKGDPITFSTQILCNCTPVELRKLNPDMLHEVDPGDIPRRLWRMMIIDPAGKHAGRDSWAIGVGGFVPARDDKGLSDLYLLDLCIRPFEYEDAMAEIVRQYLYAGGRIVKLGIENPANSTWDIHVRNALKAKGKHVSEEAGTLVLLSHGKQNKQERILANIQYPLSNRKIHVSTNIPQAMRDRLRTEMDKFPRWHDDGLDLLAYFYALIAEYNFPLKDCSAPTSRVLDMYDRAKLRNAAARRRTEDSWLYA
jgi:hypothetical protein